MKKITFVEKDDNTSYDPVNTFFSKTKASQVAKPSANSSKQSSSVKTPIQKSTQAKKQKANYVQQAKQSIPQKIGQKGGSGYIPKKVAGFGPSSYQNLKEQTIYDLKQKQSEERKNQGTFAQKADSTKKNVHVQKKPDMVFDVPNVNYDEQDDNIDVPDVIEQKELQKMSSKDSKQLRKNKLPQIKSPTTNPKDQGQVNAFQKPQVPKFQNNPQKVPKPTVKDKYFQKSEQKMESLQEKSETSEIKQKPQQQSGKKTVQIPRQKQPSSLQKPSSSKQINNPPLSKNQERQQSHQQSKSIQQKQKPANNLQQRIKQLQSYDKEYQSKIQYLEQRIQILTKIQQKYNKLFKQHKLCQEKSKDLTLMSQQLQEAKQSIQKFLAQPKVPYLKKRQYLLLNQINQLKKANRQLVLRIKNYKGTDLMEMAISKNKQEIGRQFQINYQEAYNKLNTQIQSQLSIMINKVYEYLDIKSNKNKKTSKEEMTFEKEQKFLRQLNSIAQKISLTYLEKYEVSPLPKCNQECMNLYAQIQKERGNILNTLKDSQLADKEQLNFAITQTNLQIINDLQQNMGEISSLEEKILNQLKPEQKQKANNRPSTSYGAQNKNLNKMLVKKVSFILQLFKKRSSISTAFHIQSVCYFTFMKQVMEKKLKKLQKQLVNLYARIKEMKDIYELGGNTAKESLYLYLETHLDNFTLIVPNLQCDIKQVRSTYHEISKGIDRKISINRL